MKKIRKPVTIYKDVYVAKDGKEFDNEKDCIKHERLVKGEIKICEECEGSGKIREEYWDENYHTGVDELCHRYIRCPKCQGKGYLEKKEVWV